MWRLLPGIALFWRLGPVSGSSAPDPVALLGQYRQAQASATAVTEYYQHQKDAPDQAKAFQLEAYRDLVKLSKDGQMASEDVGKVGAIVAKLEAGHFLEHRDVEVLKTVVAHLGERLVEASPTAAGMPDDLKHAIASTPNADRAIETYNELKALQQQNPERLDDGTISILTQAVAQSLTSDVLGQSGVIGKDGALHAARALLAMNPTEYVVASRILENTVDLKLALEGDPVLERALILEAIGTRYIEESPPSAATAAANMKTLREIEAFALSIHGLPRDQLIARTSIVDQTTGTNSMQQALSPSCGPTSLQLARGSEDPTFGAALVADGPLHGQSFDSRAAQDQLALLRQGQGSFFPMHIAQTFNDLEAAVAARTTEIQAKVPDIEAGREAVNDRYTTLIGTGAANAEKRPYAILRKALDDRKALLDPANKQLIEQALADPAIAATGLTKGGIFAYQTQQDIADSKIAKLKALTDFATGKSPMPDGEGLASLKATIDELNKGGAQLDLARMIELRQSLALAPIETIKQGGEGADPDDVATGYTRHAYTEESVGTETVDVDTAHLDRAATELIAGKAVPFRIDYIKDGKFLPAAHALLMTDVRGNPPDRQFEVTDPGYGVTNWVTEADLASGAFANDPRYGFNVGDARTTSFYYPQD